MGNGLKIVADVDADYANALEARRSVTGIFIVSEWVNSKLVLQEATYSGN